MSNSCNPPGLQPTRLLHPWDFPGQECWSGLPFSSPGDLPDPGIKPRSPTLQGDALPSEPPGKIMLKILRARLQQYVNHEHPDVQAGFRKGRGARGQIANIWIIEKARELQKNISSALLTLPKPLTVWLTINCGKF